jgi:hypothetical protein
MTYGGKHQRSFEKYHAIPDGWDVSSIENAYRFLHGAFDIRPLQVPEVSDPWLKYRQTLYNIADGVRANDPACVELAVRFIELHFIGSYAGYIRSLLARRLKHADLAETQKTRLSTHFVGLLRRGERCNEFTDYLRLWRYIAKPRDIDQVKQLACENSTEHPEFLIAVVNKLKAG